ncbi:MAG TPA: hypothetical protein PKC87_00595 [Candidatus Absconditabacterales bacterium]|nr:hypothetical protein [Candidatus Absconditabacterales bacterium]
MQEALDHIEKHKVYIESLGTFMIPVTEAFKVVELSYNSQLEEALALIQGTFTETEQEIQNLEDDKDSSRES